MVCGCWDMYQQYRSNTTATVNPRELVHYLSRSTQFKVGQQQCAAEFVQELVYLLGNATKELKNQGVFPVKRDFSFLQSLQFGLENTTLCTECQTATSTTSKETVLPMPVVKVETFMF